MGLIDMRQERLRKSDHLNPLQDVPHLEAVVHRAGLRIARIRYYTPIVGGFVENILMRMAERALARRADRKRTASTTAKTGTRRCFQTVSMASRADGATIGSTPSSANALKVDDIEAATTTSRSARARS